jgi:hypothetical protein
MFLPQRRKASFVCVVALHSYVRCPPWCEQCGAECDRFAPKFGVAAGRVRPLTCSLAGSRLTQTYKNRKPAWLVSSALLGCLRSSGPSVPVYRAHIMCVPCWCVHCRCIHCTVGFTRLRVICSSSISLINLDCFISSASSVLGIQNQEVCKWPSSAQWSATEHI